MTVALMMKKAVAKDCYMQEMNALLLLGHKERHKFTQTTVQNSGGSHNPILALNPANACADQGHQQGNICHIYGFNAGRVEGQKCTTGVGVLTPGYHCIHNMLLKVST